MSTRYEVTIKGQIELEEGETIAATEEDMFSGDFDLSALSNMTINSTEKGES